MPHAIRCRDLKKTYPGKPPVEAVRGIDLEVAEGECFGVLGPNGAGKTTTIEVLEGILPPTSGDVELLGLRWGEHDFDLKQKIGISLQETRLSDKLTVFETMRLFRSFYRQGISAEAAMRRVSLDEKRNTWVKRLSGGQRQRLALATALVGDPALLFLDEPTTGLDPQSRRQVWEIIRNCREQGRTILLTTHYMEEAERLCDRVAIFDEGLVIALGTPEQLIAGLEGEHVVEFSIDSSAQPPTPSFWNDLPSAQRCDFDGSRYHLAVHEPHVTIPALLNRFARHQWKLASLTTRQASLDDVFVRLTGHKLDQSDEEES